MNSKGVTPLVATVLLVVVVVAIAALIYTWTIGFTGGTLGTAETSSRGMPGEARFIVESCSASNGKIVLRNMGTINLKGFTVYCVDYDGNSAVDTVYGTSDTTQLAAGTSIVLDTNCENVAGTLTRVRVQSVQFPNLIVTRDCY